MIDTDLDYSRADKLHVDDVIVIHGFNGGGSSNVTVYRNLLKIYINNLFSLQYVVPTFPFASVIPTVAVIIS